MEKKMHVKKPVSIKQWITRAFLIILILSVMVSAAANLYQAYANNMEQDEELMTICSENIQNLLNHQWGGLEELQKSGESETYTEARRVLKQLCTNYDLDYLYIYSVDPEVPSRYYYLGVSPDEAKDRVAQTEMTLRYRPVAEILPAEQALLDGARELQHERVNNRLGQGVTWFAPYYDKNDELQALIGLDLSRAQIWQDTREDFLNDIIPFVLALIVGLLLLQRMVSRNIVTPIGAISNSMKRFAQDSRRKPAPLEEIPPLKEICEISESYEKMTDDISTYINNIESLTREKMETDVQLGVARRIQYGLVPETKKLDGDSFNIYAITRPANEVGGDFYDCFQLDDSSVCIVIGDVSGKGISAAISMAMTKTVIREKLLAGLSPADTLNQTNKEFCSHNPENLFVTAFAAILSPLTGELRYANAGHTWPVLLKESPVFLEPESGIALGMFENAGLTDHTLVLSPGQGILLYTDGVTDTVNPEKHFFGTERLLDAVKGFSEKTGTAEEVVLGLNRAVIAFSEGNEPFDDTAALALVYTGTLRQSLPVALSSFDEIKKIVFAAAGNTPDTRLALVACDEVLSNIVNYSGASNLAFSCEKQNGLLRVSFSDNGSPFDPASTETVEKEFDLLDNGGMGLSLIRQSAASIQYERKNEQNILTLFFTLHET